MTDASAPTAGDDPLWRMRWMLLASMIIVLGAVGLLVSMHHANWRWSLFVWGVIVGLAGLAVIGAAFRFVARRQQPTEDQRLRMRRRLLIYTFCWLAAGLICGAVSAAFDQPWVDVAVAIYVAATLGAGGILVFRRRESLNSTAPRS